MPDQRFLAGVDIGGTKTAVCLSSEAPTLLGRIEFPTSAPSGPGACIYRIEAALRTLIDEHAAGSLPAAIGVSCGGPLDATRGLIQSPPNLPGWDNVAVCDRLAETIGAPCFLENDANAGALAEFRFGAGSGTTNFIFLTMGTGFGAGLILGGALYRGSTAFAGEIGHVRLTAAGPVGYNKAGSVEGWASGAGMAQIALQELEAAQTTGSGGVLSAVRKAAGTVSARDVAHAAAAGDALACKITKIVGSRLGEALAILIDVLDPDAIAVGGLAIRFGESLLAPAREVVHAEALSVPARHCRILPAQLGERIGDTAALCVALDGLARIT